MAEKPNFIAVLTESETYNGEQVTELPVVEYEFVGSMYMFELVNGTSLSLGTGIVDSVKPIEKDLS